MYGDAALDQLIFLNGAAMSRSKILVNELTKKFRLPDFGRLLEIGAGKGAFLSEFSKTYPNWILNSLEYDHKYVNYLNKINNFEGNFTDINQIREFKFDLIVAVHTVEHLLDPIRYLVESKMMLNENGRIFCQVPDAVNSPFDIAIADHVAHFSVKTFKQLLLKAGLDAELQVIIPKEISAYYPKGLGEEVLVENDLDLILNIDYLVRIRDNLQRCASDDIVGVYGTTIAANWLTNIGKRIDFYVDDDRDKIGKSLNGIKILNVQEVPKDSKIFLPFSALTNDTIIRKAKKNKNYDSITFVRLEV